MPSRANRLMTNPRIVVVPPMTVRPLPATPAARPLSSTIGTPAYPGCVVASMTTLVVTAGSGNCGAIVNGPSPGMSKPIVACGVLSASRIAWRSDPGPLSAVFVTRNETGPVVGTVTVTVAAAESAPDG